MIVIISDPLYTYACLFEIELMCISLLIAYTFHLISCLLSASLAKEGRIYESTLLCLIFYTRVPQQNIMQSKTQCRNDVQNWAQPHFDCRCTVKTENVIMPCTMGTVDGDETTHENENGAAFTCYWVSYTALRRCLNFRGTFLLFPNSDVHVHTCRKEWERMQ